MKKGIWKKLAIGLCLFASAIVVGTSVTGWIKDAKDKNTDTEGENQACIECVMDS